VSGPTNRRDEMDKPKMKMKKVITVKANAETYDISLHEEELDMIGREKCERLIRHLGDYVMASLDLRHARERHGDLHECLAEVGVAVDCAEEKVTELECVSAYDKSTDDSEKTGNNMVTAESNLSRDQYIDEIPF
jgi:hypothetical protein